MDALNLADYLYKKLRQRRDDIQVSLAQVTLVRLMTIGMQLGR